MSPEARRPAELLVADVRRLADLVEDLMEISRLDADQTRLREEDVDLSSLVAAIVRSRRWEDVSVSRATRSCSPRIRAGSSGSSRT